MPTPDERVTLADLDTLTADLRRGAPTAWVTLRHLIDEARAARTSTTTVPGDVVPTPPRPTAPVDRPTPAPPAPRRPTTPAPSAKRAGIATWWTAALREEIDLGGGFTAALGSMTADDLRTAATHHAETARTTMQRAQVLDRLRALLTHHGAATVADLPRAVLDPTLRAIAGPPARDE